MNKIKRLLKVYSISRNLPLLLNNPVSSRTLCHYSNDNKDTLPNSISAHKTSSLLTARLKQCLQIEETLDLIRTNVSTMTTNQILIGIQKIYELSDKDGSLDAANQKEVIQLFRMIETRSRKLNVQQIITALKLIDMWEYRNSSENEIILRLTTSLCQLLRVLMNDLSLSQIAAVQRILKNGHIRPTHITEGLGIALPIVFKANLKRKLDKDSIYSLEKTLDYASNLYSGISREDIDLIINGIHDCKQPMSMKCAKDMFFSFMRLNYFPKRVSESILPRIFDTLSRSIRQVDSTLLIILHRMGQRMSQKRERIFYNENFVEKYIDKLIETNASLSDCTSVFQSLNRMRHASARLLDYVAGEIFNMVSSGDIVDRFDIIYRFTGGMDIADYKPPLWNEILNQIINKKTHSPSRITAMNDLRWAFNCAILDHYEPQLLAELFDSSDSKSYYSPRDLSQMKFLYQCVKTMFPTYQGPWPSSEVLNNLLDYHETGEKVPLKAALERALGGSQYVKHNIKTSLGHLIDHVVVMRKGGYPVAINVENSVDSTEPLESITYPSGSQVILILNLSDEAYSINLRRMCRKTALYIRTIETLTGHSVVPINSYMWDQLYEQERIPYLMQAINAKVLEMPMEHSL